MSRKDREELPEELLEILCCPDDKANLKYDRKDNVLICVSCGKKYPVKKGIPILLPKD